MKKMSLVELEHRLQGHIYKDHLLLAIKGAILRFKPLAVILLGPLTQEAPGSMAEAEVLLIMERGECPMSRRKRMGRVDEFGVLDLSFLEATQLLKMVKDGQGYAREVMRDGVVIYTRDEGTWMYICEMASALSCTQQSREGVH